MNESPQLIERIREAAEQLDVYRTAQQRRWVFSTMGDRRLRVLRALPASASPGEQLKSDIAELARRSGPDGEPLACWIDAVHRCVVADGVDCPELLELKAAWLLDAQTVRPSQEGFWSKTAASLHSTCGWRAAMVLVISAALVTPAALWLAADEMQCGEGDITPNHSQMLISGRNVVFDTGYLNRRLRRWQTDDGQAGVTPIKVLHSRFGADAFSQVRLSAAIGRDVTELALEATAGSLMVVADKPMAVQALSLIIDGSAPLPVVFDTAGSADRKLIFGGECLDGDDSWPSIDIENGFFVTRHPR